MQPFNLGGTDHFFGGSCCLYLQGRSRTLWRRKQQVSLKHWSSGGMWSVWLNRIISRMVQGRKVCPGVHSDSICVAAMQRVHVNMTKFVTVSHSSAGYIPCLGTQCCHSFSFLVFLFLCFDSRHVHSCRAPSLTTRKMTRCCNPVDQNMCCQISWRTRCTHQKTYVVSEDGQELGLTHVRAIIDKTIVQKVSIKYYIYICKTIKLFSG